MNEEGESSSLSADRSAQEEAKNILTTKVAKELKLEYYRLKAKKERRSYKEPTSFNDIEIWKRVARVVEDLHTDPYFYLEAQFALAEGTLFPNALHGPVAQKRYRRYAVLKRSHSMPNDDETPEDVTMTSSESGQQDLQDAIEATLRALIVYCGGDDLYDPVVRASVLEKELFWDPFVMICLCCTPEFIDRFGLRAKRELDRNPKLRLAAIDSGLGMVVDAIEKGGLQ